MRDRGVRPPLILAMLLLATVGGSPVQGQENDIEAVLIHPPVAARFQCSEHALGSEDHAPDALGSDCVVVRRGGGPDGTLNAPFSGDGTRNEAGFGWLEPRLAPFDGVVTSVSLNAATTEPGRFGPGRSSAMVFRKGLVDDPDAVQVAFVHMREVMVSEGDTVRAGQPVARIGNNGRSYNPHVHIGAFRGDVFSGQAVPLQVRMDLEAMGRLRGSLPPG